MENIVEWSQRGDGRRSVALFLLTAIIQVLLLLSCVVRSEVSLHTCGTQMTDGTARFEKL